ncbi:trna binding domain protein [Liquorilactobacillus aquaticus DSM 21051]|uniref:Trna binding domain protein n=1 Tax=Liquorilactobacillus aquaticus DSM 21051 TaxID=1423725 RepID=A0A0R2CY69_9LACO|nr:DUF4479 and tRNA-binding domain-containing protein [Liquorilactobacillus aquaticus]KRM96631.1 trna binding domain protein [Liquorilactobacillus aquaticus DSM 21051]
MLIASYNPSNLGDILITITHADTLQQKVDIKNNIVRIRDAETGNLLGYNFFNVSDIIGSLNGQGQVKLNDDQLADLNKILAETGFEDKLVADNKPKFVVGFVEELKEHPDSDHLHVTKTRIDNGEVLQIVCGAPNIAQGQTVVVAKVGAMMPNGEIIWPGKLRGVQSEGMICSARELNLPNAPQKKGILVLSHEKYPTGKEFVF